MTGSMRAAVFSGAGGADSVDVRQVPVPVPGSGEVLVRVRASALNRADILQREGRYPPPAGAPRDIAGLEFAGEIVVHGDGAGRHAVGARVFGLIDGGAHAEHVAVDERLLVSVPESLSWVEAGATPEAFITAHDALVTQAGARAGERVLIHAVGSGVGTAAVQAAGALQLRPYGTTRSGEKLERARGLGLVDGAVLDTPGALPALVERWTEGAGMDVILDLVGGDYVKPSIESLALRGRLVLIGTIAGRSAELPLGRVLGRRLTVRGTVLRSRTLDEKAGATEAFARDLLPPLSRRSILPVIDSVFPIAAIRDAHRRMESNDSFGKIVVTMG